MSEIDKIAEMIGAIHVTGSASELRDVERLLSAITELQTRISEQTPDPDLPENVVIEEATPNRSS